MSRTAFSFSLIWFLMAILLPIQAFADTAPITPLPPVTNPDGFTGTCYSFYPDPFGQIPGRPFVPLMLNAGSRWDRFDFPWPLLEPRDGQWDEEAVADQDQLVSDLRVAGMNILGILLWTPNWAAAGNCTLGMAAPRPDRQLFSWHAPVLRGAIASMAQTSSCITTPPRGLYEEWDDWTTDDGDPINYWGRFVYALAYRYRDPVKHWEVWNEPDLHWFWNGTSTDYAQLLKVAYRAIKAACRDCTVLFGGIAFYEKPDFYRLVLENLRNDPAGPESNYFFDAMAVHLYSRPSSIYDVVQVIRSGMRQFSLNRPIWLTETGVPMWDDASIYTQPVPYIWSATQEEAASYVLQSYANARAAGVQRYFYFRAHDDWCDKNRDGDCDDWGIDYGMGQLFGLVRDDRSLRPAYVAYQVAATYLVSPTMVTNVNYSGGVRRVTFWGTPWGKVSVLWNTVPTPTVFSYPATLPTATLVDQRGITYTITPSDNFYSLPLPGATANNGLNSQDYIIGGETYLVIETDTVPPTATIRSVDASAPPTVTVSWEGSDDAAGIWRYDLQVREGMMGTWSPWLNFTSATTAAYTVPQSGTWCFRVRAWDRAGNRGDWLEAACEEVLLERTVRLRVEAVFGDEDGDGVQGPEEEPVTATLRLLGAMGENVVSPAVGTSWEFTATLGVGTYVLDVAPVGWPSLPPAWLPRRLPVQVVTGAGVQETALAVGLLPHRASVYLPVMQK